MADVEHKLEDLHHAIERRLEEQGALLMQHAGLEQDVARREQQTSNVRRCHNCFCRQLRHINKYIHLDKKEYIREQEHTAITAIRE